MKNFVKVEIEGDTEFHYPSGKTTSRMNMGQITKIAFELKQITQRQLDEMDSSDEEMDTSATDQESIEKRSKQQSWFHFCEEKVTALEKTWNRKLEHAGQEPVAKSILEDDNDNEEEHEQTIENLFANFNANRLIRANNAKRSNSLGTGAAALQSTQEDFKKDETVGEFGDNQFWNKPCDDSDLDSILAEME